MPLEFQLALQGGGAKLSDLLVSLSVLQDYENNGLIQINGITGTSAGAIAAAIYSCGDNSCQQALDYLEKSAPDASKRIIPKLSRWNFLFRIIPSIWRGSSIVDSLKIKNEIEGIFTHLLRKDASAISISDLMNRSPNLKKLSFVTTDLVSGQAVDNSSSNDRVVDAMFDSCAIPIAFKGAESLSHPYVDGGLCENLPTMFLEVVLDFGPA